MDRRTKISTSLFIRHLSREKLMPACAPHIIMAHRGSPSHRPGRPDKPHYTNVEQYILRKFKFVVFASLHLSAAGVVSLSSSVSRRNVNIQFNSTTTTTSELVQFKLLFMPVASSRRSSSQCKYSIQFDDDDDIYYSMYFFFGVANIYYPNIIIIINHRDIMGSILFSFSMMCLPVCLLAWRFDFDT